MASINPDSALTHDLVRAIRTADVLTGSFLRPISAEAMAKLEALNLASSAAGALTRRGLEIRTWLMSGTEHAPLEVSRLLQATAGQGGALRFALGGPG